MEDEEIQNEEENGEEENTEVLIPVFSTDHPGIIAVVKSMLDEAGIQYLVKGDGLQTLFALGTVQFFVTPDNEEMARALLEDVKESEPITGESVPEEISDITDIPAEDFDEDSSLEDTEEK